MFSLFVVGALVLVWVGSLTLNDISVWNKDIGNIFFGSRTGEAISLGIGMTLINYVLIGVVFFAAGTVLFLRNRMLADEQPQPTLLRAPQKSKNSNQARNGRFSLKSSKDNVEVQEERFFSGCLHHFGYLSSRPKDSPVPQECILCQRLGDCMLATVYVKDTSE